ncbi:hypothetical protein CEUSTIGMA_g9348.t1 [Chlamydomonas eustigma]|uniref:DNA mismatch repair protein S5 domain-containing protein n=1 Tax=Chlamydomonas eustigma TaxID=1157962 RepID=A0A250XGK6_9CHLO|nr:hypothetical protein CEUSTIGMA_g9348.t1 [Chlamydomonas eustigma]|eukprot:GAX81920.1 hypothetical protein CEUSTIGMA_g9348.t1 [Chlamydomonas eustigma]
MSGSGCSKVRPAGPQALGGKRGTQVFLKGFKACNSAGNVEAFVHRRDEGVRRVTLLQVVQTSLLTLMPFPEVSLTVKEISQEEVLLKLHAGRDSIVVLKLLFPDIRFTQSQSHSASRDLKRCTAPQIPHLAKSSSGQCSQEVSSHSSCWLKVSQNAYLLEGLLLKAEPQVDFSDKQLLYVNRRLVQNISVTSLICNLHAQRFSQQQSRGSGPKSKSGGSGRSHGRGSASVLECSREAVTQALHKQQHMQSCNTMPGFVLLLLCPVTEVELNVEPDHTLAVFQEQQVVLSCIKELVKLAWGISQEALGDCSAPVSKNDVQRSVKDISPGPSGVMKAFRGPSSSAHVISSLDDILFPESRGLRQSNVSSCRSGSGSGVLNLNPKTACEHSSQHASGERGGSIVSSARARGNRSQGSGERRLAKLLSGSQAIAPKSKRASLASIHAAPAYGNMERIGEGVGHGDVSGKYREAQYQEVGSGSCYPVVETHISKDPAAHDALHAACIDLQGTQMRPNSLAAFNQCVDYETRNGLHNTNAGRVLEPFFVLSTSVATGAPQASVAPLAHDPWSSQPCVQKLALASNVSADLNIWDEFLPAGSYRLCNPELPLKECDVEAERYKKVSGKGDEVLQRRQVSLGKRSRNGDDDWLEAFEEDQDADLWPRSRVVNTCPPSSNEFPIIEQLWHSQQAPDLVDMFSDLRQGASCDNDEGTFLCSTLPSRREQVKKAVQHAVLFEDCAVPICENIAWCQQAAVEKDFRFEGYTLHSMNETLSTREHTHDCIPTTLGVPANNQHVHVRSDVSSSQAEKDRKQERLSYMAGDCMGPQPASCIMSHEVAYCDGEEASKLGRVQPITDDAVLLDVLDATDDVVVEVGHNLEQALYCDRADELQYDTSLALQSAEGFTDNSRPTEFRVRKRSCTLGRSSHGDTSESFSQTPSGCNSSPQPSQDVQDLHDSSRPATSTAARDACPTSELKLNTVACSPDLLDPHQAHHYSDVLHPQRMDTILLPDSQPEEIAGVSGSTPQSPAPDDAIGNQLSPVTDAAEDKSQSPKAGCAVVSSQSPTASRPAIVVNSSQSPTASRSAVPCSPHAGISAMVAQSQHSDASAPEVQAHSGSDPVVCDEEANEQNLMQQHPLPYVRLDPNSHVSGLKLRSHPATRAAMMQGPTDSYLVAEADNNRHPLLLIPECTDNMGQHKKETITSEANIMDQTEHQNTGFCWIDYQHAMHTFKTSASAEDSHNACEVPTTAFPNRPLSPQLCIQTCNVIDADAEANKTFQMLHTTRPLPQHPGTAAMPCKSQQVDPDPPVVEGSCTSANLPPQMIMGNRSFKAILPRGFGQRCEAGSSTAAQISIHTRGDVQLKTRLRKLLSPVNPLQGGADVSKEHSKRFKERLLPQPLSNISSNIGHANTIITNSVEKPSIITKMTHDSGPSEAPPSTTSLWLKQLTEQWLGGCRGREQQRQVQQSHIVLRMEDVVPQTGADPGLHAACQQEVTRAMLEEAHVIGQADNKFIFMRSGTTLLVADQHAAHERILLEHLISRVEVAKSKRMEALKHDLNHMPRSFMVGTDAASRPTLPSYHHEQDILVRK